MHGSYMVRSSEAFPGPSFKYSSSKKSSADASEASCTHKASDYRINGH